jgi:undecaprenyl-diphosphatase
MDEAILRSLNSLAAVPFFATLGVLFSSKWFAAAVLAPIAVQLARQKRWIAMVSVALAMGTADVASSQLVKPAFDRQRPCRALKDLERPVSCGPGESFPSNHATNAFAFLLSAAPLFRFGWLLLTPVAMLIATSRVLLGVHYPSDVLGGAVIGAMFGALAWWGRWRLSKRASLRSTR